ncbi:MAG: type II toxin-antitoxin system RelE/ParE family toxin [Paludibacteraceae bacterium]|nr:type II toxin-antitoxin system RelE/ParE family toxin [Paludibacteraceae bacterium]MBQ9143875.1 type II toxin-antitoxin system RelE/ParE family toxin [Paludibacteraceae bacterium]
MIQLRVTKDFGRQFKRLLKKYRSLSEDIRSLSEQIIENPTLGTDLGEGVRKIRLAVRSKGKGKSGGLRVITHINIILEENEGTITYLYIYDKSEMANISDEKVVELLREII